MMKYIIIFHSNITYSNLHPQKYDFVCRKSYERLIDLFAKQYPDAKWNMNMSGFTLDYIAEHVPDILDKFKKTISKGNCALLGTSYAHSILTNFPHEDSLYSLRFTLDSFQKHLNVQPKIAWNPECCWTQEIPKMVKVAGYEAMITDWESYILTRDNITDVVPLHYHAVHDKGAKSLKYPEVDPGDKSLHYPVKIKPGLKGIMRTDRTSLQCLKYFQGEISLQKLLDVIDRYSTGHGFLVVFAEDTEYIGTSAYYYLKYYGDYSRLFEDSPESVERLSALIDALQERGELCTISEVLSQLLALDEPIHIRDGLAWHMENNEAWTKTPSALKLDPKCDMIREQIKQVETRVTSDADKQKIRKAWWYLVQAETSDGRWPAPPYAPGDFNIKFCEDMLGNAKNILASFETVDLK